MGYKMIEIICCGQGACGVFGMKEPGCVMFDYAQCLKDIYHALLVNSKIRQ
jgi:hypothetical protein